MEQLKNDRRTYDKATMQPMITEDVPEGQLSSFVSVSGPAFDRY